MFTIEKKRLKEIGFCQDYKNEFSKGSVIVILDKKNIEVKIMSAQSGSAFGASRAKGVKSEEDLLLLCKLVDGE